MNENKPSEVKRYSASEIKNTDIRMFVNDFNFYKCSDIDPVIEFLQAGLKQVQGMRDRMMTANSELESEIKSLRAQLVESESIAKSVLIDRLNNMEDCFSEFYDQWTVDFHSGIEWFRVEFKKFVETGKGDRFPK